MPDDEQDIDESVPFWEAHARDSVLAMVEDARLDEAKGTITLPYGVDHNFDSLYHAFSTYESIYDALTEVAESTWNDYVPYDHGPVFEPSVDGIVEEAIDQLRAEDFFARFPRPAAGEELYASSDTLTTASTRILRVQLELVDRELIARLAKHPELMRELSPRKFEELIADLLRSEGFGVELTPFSKDGGFDIIAFQKDMLGAGMILVECKQYSMRHPVGVELVRALYGVVQKRDATRGVIVTTSRFTRGAKAFRKDLQYRLSLLDFANLKELLARYKHKPHA